MKLLRTSDGKILRAEPIPTNTGYGALYNWYAATYNTGGASIAPSGWHVPSSTEFGTLITAIGGTDYGDKLKEVGITYWDAGNNGTNIYVFNGRGSGNRGVGFAQLKHTEKYYTTSLSSNRPIVYTLEHDSQYLIFSIQEGFVNGNSVRFLKDDSTYVPYLDDIDGNRYPVVKIGSQVWMAANLQVTHYNDGTAIPNVTSNTDWANLTSGAYCIYNNDTQYISNIQGATKILRVETT